YFAFVRPVALLQQDGGDALVVVEGQGDLAQIDVAVQDELHRCGVALGKPPSRNSRASRGRKEREDQESPSHPQVCCRRAYLSRTEFALGRGRSVLGRFLSGSHWLVVVRQSGRRCRGVGLPCLAMDKRRDGHGVLRGPSRMSMCARIMPAASRCAKRSNKPRQMMAMRPGAATSWGKRASAVCGISPRAMARSSNALIAAMPRSTTSW